VSVQDYVLIKVSEKAPKEVKTRIRKIMRGTTVTIKGKGYRSRGLLEEVNGTALAGGVYMVPSSTADRVVEKLSEKNLMVYVEIISLCTCPCR
jgi:hypothetical protein